MKRTTLLFVFISSIVLADDPAPPPSIESLIAALADDDADLRDRSEAAILARGEEAEAAAKKALDGEKDPERKARLARIAATFDARRLRSALVKAWGERWYVFSINGEPQVISRVDLTMDGPALLVREEFDYKTDPPCTSQVRLAADSLTLLSQRDQMEGKTPGEFDRDADRDPGDLASSFAVVALRAGLLPRRPGSEMSLTLLNVGIAETEFVYSRVGDCVVRFVREVDGGFEYEFTWSNRTDVLPAKIVTNADGVMLSCDGYEGTENGLKLATKEEAEEALKQLRK